MKILVTGATGFIGSHLVHELVRSGHKVAVLARKNSSVEHLNNLGVDVRYGDVTDLLSVIEACKGVDTVIHLAAITSSEGTDYEESFLVNVVGSQNVIDACKINQVSRIIYMGTQSDNPGAYARTKRKVEELFRDSGLNVTIIKPSLVYGPGDKGLFSSMAKFIKKFPVIPIVGSGKYPMKPIYVGDVTKAITSCLERSDLKTVYFLSGPEEITYSQWMDAIAKAMGLKRIKLRIPYFLIFLGVRFVSMFFKKFPVTVDTLKGLVNPRTYDSRQAEDDLGFMPLTLQEGLKKTFTQVVAEK